MRRARSGRGNGEPDRALQHAHRLALLLPWLASAACAPGRDWKTPGDGDPARSTATAEGFSPTNRVIDAAPSPCIIAPGESTCSVRVRWIGPSDAPFVQIWLRSRSGGQSLFACTRSGRLRSKQAPWITSRSSVFTVYRATSCAPRDRGEPRVAIRARGLRAETIADINRIRSTTVHLHKSGPDGQRSYVADQLDTLKDLGANTVWLVNPWHWYDPKPLASPRQYNDAAFETLRATLDVLRGAEMKAFIGLNYLGKTFGPDFGDRDRLKWVQDPEMYGAFVQYVERLLTEISDYSDMVYLLAFTEVTYPRHATAPEHAQMLAKRLGNLPNQIRRGIRDRFLFGYHDNVLIARDWAKGETPIATPNPFDFVSSSNYVDSRSEPLEDLSDAEIETELDVRRARFSALHPNVPLVLGEFGGSCRAFPRLEEQFRVNTAVMRNARTHSNGFNLWGLHLIPGRSCGDASSDRNRYFFGPTGDPLPHYYAFAAYAQQPLRKVGRIWGVNAAPCSTGSAAVTCAADVHWFARGNYSHAQVVTSSGDRFACRAADGRLKSKGASGLRGGEEELSLYLATGCEVADRRVRVDSATIVAGGS